MNLMDEVAGGLDGLSQLRTLMASGRKPGIMVSLGLDFVEIEAGKAVFTERRGSTPTIRSARSMAAILQRCWTPLAAARCIPVSRRRRPIRPWN
jgi:hypothetical protein